MGNTAQQCRMGLFQDSDFAGDLEDSNSNSGRILCIFGSHTFVPISWMCKKQTSVSHSSTESEIISLDASLRMDGIHALDLWDLIVEVLHSCSNQAKRPKEQARRDLQRNKPSSKHTNTQIKTQIQHNGLELSSVDYVSSNVKFSRSGCCFYIFEDNESVIKMIFSKADVEESYPTPHIHEQMTTSNYGYDTAYNFTHNNIMLEPNAMNNMDTVAHMNVHNTQY